MKCAIVSLQNRLVWNNVEVPENLVMRNCMKWKGDRT